MAQPIRPAKCRVSVINRRAPGHRRGDLEVVAQPVEKQAVVETGKKRFRSRYR